MSDRSVADRGDSARRKPTLPDRLIVVDDDPGVADFVTAAAQRCGYETRAVGSLPALQELYPVFEATIIALDLTMPEADGIEVMHWLAESGCKARILLVGDTTQDLLDVATRLGRALGLDIAATLMKPFGLAAVADQLHRLSSTA
jgi:DNA-binding response OmpR family regulator